MPIHSYNYAPVLPVPHRTIFVSCKGLIYLEGATASWYIVVSSPDTKFFACALWPCRKIGSGHVHRAANKYREAGATLLVIRSRLLAKWSREWIKVRAGARECNTFFSLVLQNVVNIFVFVGAVASYNPFKHGELSETP